MRLGPHFHERNPGWDDFSPAHVGGQRVFWTTTPVGGVIRAGSSVGAAITTSVPWTQAAEGDLDEDTRIFRFPENDIMETLLPTGSDLDLNLQVPNSFSSLIRQDFLLLPWTNTMLVQATIDGPVEAPQKLAPAGSAPAEATQKLAIVGVSSPAEETQKLAIVGSADPAEATAKRAVSALAFPSEALQKLVATGSASPAEAPQGLAATLAAASEALQRLGIVGAVVPLELVKLLTIAGSSGAAEWLQKLAAVGSGDPIDSTAGIATTPVSQTAVIPLEWMQALAIVGNADPAELLTKLATVAGSAPAEQLTRLSAAGAASPSELLQRLAVTAQGPAETNQRLAVTALAPSEWLAALRVTAAGGLSWLLKLTGVATGPSETLTALATSLLSPTEGGQAVASAITEPVERLAALRASGGPVPAEGDQGVAATASGPSEATQALRVSGQTTAEALASVHAAGSSNPLEVLQGVMTVLGAPFEFTGLTAAITQTASLPIDVQQRIGRSSGSQIESLAGVLASVAASAELLQGLSTQAPEPLDWTKRISAQMLAAFENLGIPTFPVSQTATFPIDVAQIVRAPATTSGEATRTIAASAAAVVDQLARLGLSVAGILEAGGGVAGVSSLPEEAARGLAILGATTAETLRPVTQSKTAALEALQRLRQLLTAPYERDTLFTVEVVGQVTVSNAAVAAVSLDEKVAAGVAIVDAAIAAVSLIDQNP